MNNLETCMFVLGSRRTTYSLSRYEMTCLPAGVPSSVYVLPSRRIFAERGSKTNPSDRKGGWLVPLSMHGENRPLGATLHLKASFLLRGGISSRAPWRQKGEAAMVNSGRNIATSRAKQKEQEEKCTSWGAAYRTGCRLSTAH